MQKYMKLTFAMTSALMLVASTSAFATDTPAVTVAGTANNLGNGPFTLGFNFTTTTSFTLDGLGIYDQDGDGLVDSHDVGLWDAGGTLLTSTTVGAGTTGSLISGFRFASITPVTITPGTYNIGALFLGCNDPNFFGGDGALSTISGLTFVSGAYASGATLSNPVNPFGAAPAFIGPNFLVSSAVPEPATWALMLLGFGMAGYAMRKRPNVRTRVSFS